MSALATLLERPLVYRLWQAPFERQKLQPVLDHNDLSRVRSVLDVGCGPGTNSRYFAGGEYLGLDLNPRYVDYARRRYGRDYRVEDVTLLGDSRLLGGKTFDFILVNSLLHHLSDESARKLLEWLVRCLDEDGHVHLLELVLPAQHGLARVLARADRGKFARSLEDWKRIWAGILKPEVMKEYQLGWPGLTLWNMVYVKGRSA